MTMGKGFEHMLIVRVAALGDLVMTSALLERIRVERPRARVSWLCGSRGAPIVRLFSGVHHVIEVDERALLAGGAMTRAVAMFGLWRRLWRRGFTDVLIAHADPRFRLIAAPCTGARVRMLQRGSGAGAHPVPGRFFGDEYARLLDTPESTGPIAARYDIADVRSNVPPLRDGLLPTSQRPLVALVPGGARNVLRDAPMRRWPIERYVEIARALTDDGADVALIGDDGDRWARAPFEGIPVVDLLGRLSLVETLAVLARASLVVSHDTGPLHLARSVRAPTIALFGPTMPRQMLGAAAPDVDVLWGGEQLPCRPCYDGREFAKCNNNLCMKDISGEEVLRRARSRLESSQQSGILS